MTTETYDDPQAFIAALAGKKRTTRGRTTRPDIPSAPRAAATGLSTFIKAGWNWTYVVGRGYKLERGPLSTGWRASEALACAAARGMGR